MIKRIIYIGSPCNLNIKDEQLIITNRDTGEINSVPVQDIGALEIDNLQATISAYTLSFMAQHNVVVVISGANHHPIAQMLSLDSNIIQSQRIAIQVNAKVTLIKNIWAQVVAGKIENQYLLLKLNGIDDMQLKLKYQNVQSGDKGNLEGQAAKIYWKQLFANRKFKRDADGDYPNNLLNYGYAILRAIVARAIVSSGLSPSIGIFHKNKYNAYCLADDLMEPFRPYIDKLVLDNIKEMEETNFLTKEHKKIILNAPFVNTVIDGNKYPLMIGVQESVASFLKCLEGKTKKLSLPKICK